MNWNLVPSNCEDETITNVFLKNHHFKLTPEGPVTQIENPLLTIEFPEMPLSFLLLFHI